MEDFGFGACDAFLERLLIEGTSILAETLRLADFVPNDFKDPTKSKFRPFIVDFSYFSKAAQIEKQLSSQETLQDLFYATHGPLLNRFELLFQAVANFLISFNEYCEQVSTGRKLGGVDRTTELEVECLYTCGLVLLYLDKFLSGLLRERLYIAIFRNSDDRSNVEYLVDFLRVAIENNDTLFKRAFTHDVFVQHCIAALEFDQRETGHVGRSRRLQARRSEMMFVCLLFDVRTLHGDASRMRQITDTYFRDNWVLSLGVGLVVNLFDAWQPFKAAGVALNAIVDAAKASQVANEHQRVLSEISLPQGEILPSQFAQNTKIISEYNRSLRWLVLHSYDKCCGRRGYTLLQAMDAAVRFEKSALIATLRVAKFEMEFLKTYKCYLRERDERARKLIGESSLLLNELADIFAQGFASLKVEKKERLNGWFLLLKKAVDELRVDDPVESIELVQQIKRQIARVGDMLDLRGNFAVAQYLEKISAQLESLSAVFLLSDDVVRGVEAAADPEYLWTMIDDWTPRVQQRLLSASTTQPVRALFHKLSLSLAALGQRLPDGPQHTDAVRRISRAFSFFLDRRLRNILQSVPHHLFAIMHDVVEPSLKNKWQPLLDKTEAKALADFEENFRLADATYTISNMSVGISRMALRRVGTVDVNPKELLEEGIRRELANELPDVLKVAEKDPNLADIIAKSDERLRCLHTAFIYTCEHMDIDGHEMWRDELHQLCVASAEERLERTTEVRRKSAVGQPTLDCIVDLIYRATNPSTSRYVESEMVWLDAKSKKEVLTSQELVAIEAMIPCHALMAIDRVLSHDLQQTLYENLRQWRMLLANIAGLPNSAPPDVDFFKSAPFEQLNKVVHANAAQLSAQVAKVGQLVLLRRRVNDTKRDGGRRRAAPVYEALNACNKTLLATPGELPQAVDAVCEMLALCSLLDPQRVPMAVPHSLAAVAVATPLFVLHVAVASRLADAASGRRDALCAPSFVTGVAFVARQLDAGDAFVEASRAFAACQLAMPRKQRGVPPPAVDVARGAAAAVVGAN